MEKAGGGACASTHHRGSALRRGGTTPGVVSSAACAVTLARSSFTSRAHSHVARVGAPSVHSSIPRASLVSSFPSKFIQLRSPTSTRPARLAENENEGTDRDRGTLFFHTTVRSPSVMCDQKDLARPLPINENDARK